MTTTRRQFLISIAAIAVAAKLPGATPTSPLGAEWLTLLAPSLKTLRLNLYDATGRLLASGACTVPRPASMGKIEIDVEQMDVKDSGVISRSVLEADLWSLPLDIHYSYPPIVSMGDTVAIPYLALT